MRIYLKTLVGKVISIDIEESSTIRLVRKAASEASGFPENIIFLKHQGRDLSLEENIDDLQIFEEDFLYIYFKIEEKKTSFWKPELDTAQTKKLRIEMVEKMRISSNFKDIFKQNVLDAMKVTPRHQFIDKNIHSGDWMSLSYNFQKPMRTSTTSVSSSPEVIAAMLSLVDIQPDHQVCVFGIKGGYIQSLISQIINVSGSMICYSSDRKSFETIRKRTEELCPYWNLQQWILANDIFDFNPILDYKPFDVVIVCGAIPKYENFVGLMKEDWGQFVAPVNSGTQIQKLIVLEKKEGRLKKQDGKLGVRFGILN